MQERHDSAWALLASRWKVLGVWTVLGAVGGLAYTVLSPAVYRAQAAILVSPGSPGGANILNPFGTETATPVSILYGVLDSQETVDTLAKHFGITPQEFRRSYFVRPDELTGQVALTADFADRTKSTQALDQAIQYAHRLELDASKSTSTISAQQLQTRLLAKQKELDSAQKDFAESLVLMRDVPVGDLTDLGALHQQLDTARADLGRVDADLRAQRNKETDLLKEQNLPQSGALEQLRIKLEQVKLVLINKQRTEGPDSPALKSAQNDVSAAQQVYDHALHDAREAVRRNLDFSTARIEANRSVLQWKVSFLQNALEKAPEQAMRLTLKVDHIKDLERTTADLRAKYEIAKTDAEVERVRWTVLSPPRLEERPINKRYARGPAAGGALALLVGTVLVFLRPGKGPKS